jgi:hypothetical protein
VTYSNLKGAILAEKIDWIAYSQAINLEWNFPDYIDDHWKEVKPIARYDHAEENKQGVKRFWNKENPSQGRYVVLPGVASGILQENQFDFLQWVNTPDRKATRIDYALDITHSRLSVAMASAHLLHGAVRTHAQSALRINDTLGTGDTQYVGKKTSETYTRIYDKGTEQKTDYSWLRVETVYQGERARPSLASYCQHKSTRTLIQHHVDFPAWRDWTSIMQGRLVKLDTPPRETATRAWLLGQVATALAKELRRDDDHTFWFDFSNRVNDELLRISQKDDNIDF